MRRIHKFLTLSTLEQQLVLKSMFWLTLITIGLRVLSFQTLWCFLTGLALRFNKLDQTDQPTIEQITWAIRAASQYVPTASCLPQALVGQLLLKQNGYPAHLQIGVTKSKDGRLEAHAWVVSQGQIVTGKTINLSRYTSLPSLEGPCV